MRFRGRKTTGAGLPPVLTWLLPWTATVRLFGGGVERFYRVSSESDYDMVTLRWLSF